jgi:hypothetical protein
MSDRSDMDPRQTEIDSLLRQSLAAPVPRLSPDFHQSLSRKLQQGSEPSKQFARFLLAGYGVVSALVSVVLMRSQGLGWVPIAVMTLALLATLGLASLLRLKQSGITAK